jgi:hypothetical protein
VSEVSGGILEEEVKQGILRGAHCRFQTPFDKIREPEGCYDSVRYPRAIIFGGSTALGPW